MSSSHGSRRTIFRQISRRSHIEWPAYDSTPLYDRTSLAGLESDVRTVSERWFRHDAHDSVDEFVRLVPLAYFRFGMHDCYTDLTSYEMQTLFRLFLLKECHGWDYETALVEYLQ